MHAVGDGVRDVICVEVVVLERSGLGGGVFLDLVIVESVICLLVDYVGVVLDVVVVCGYPSRRGCACEARYPCAPRLSRHRYELSGGVWREIRALVVGPHCIDRPPPRLALPERLQTRFAHNARAFEYCLGRERISSEVAKIARKTTSGVMSGRLFIALWDCRVAAQTVYP